MIRVKFAKIIKNYKVRFLSLVSFVAIAILIWKPLAIKYDKWLAAGEKSSTENLLVLLFGSKERLKTLINLNSKGKISGLNYEAEIDETIPVLECYRNIPVRYSLSREIPNPAKLFQHNCMATIK